MIGESGKLYLAAILDLYSRFVVGWAVSAVNDRRLTLKALEMAVQRRCPEPGLLHHSDRGCTYTCEDYQTYLASRGITCSMSRRGDCYDNAVMESFFATVKKEEAERFPSYSDAKMALFDYIEVFYNQRRRHSTLGQISPAAFERQPRRRAWTLPSLWTPRTRPQGFGKPHRTRFPTAPTPIILVYEEERRPKRPTLTNLSTDSDQVQFRPYIRR